MGDGMGTRGRETEERREGLRWNELGGSVGRKRKA